MRVLWNLWCDATTEAGEDEIYLLVAARTSDGRTFSTRLPGPGDHWNFNDGKEPRNHNGIVLADLGLGVGQAAKVVVVIMEEDGGTSQPWGNVLAAVLDEIPSGVTQVAAGIVGLINSFINFQDSDDYIGSFEVTVSRDANGYSTTWHALERCSPVPNGGGPGTYGFRFNGDGSNYFGWGIVA